MSLFATEEIRFRLGASCVAGFVRVQPGCAFHTPRVTFWTEKAQRYDTRPLVNKTLITNSPNLPRAELEWCIVKSESLTNQVLAHNKAPGKPGALFRFNLAGAQRVDLFAFSDMEVKDGVIRFQH